MSRTGTGEASAGWRRPVRSKGRAARGAVRRRPPGLTRSPGRRRQPPRPDLPRPDLPRPDLPGQIFLCPTSCSNCSPKKSRRACSAGPPRTCSRLVTDALVERGPLYEGAKAFATPRRLALHVAGLPARSPDMREEKKGPRVGAPRARRIDGFLKSAGLASIDEAQGRDRPKKGDFYVAVSSGRAAATEELARRDRARGRARVPVAEVDALGRGIARARVAALGAPAPLDPLHLRPRDRGARGRRRSRSTASAPATSRPATASWRPAPIKVRRFDDYVRRSSAPRSCSTPTGARTSSGPTPATSRSRRG